MVSNIMLLLVLISYIHFTAIISRKKDFSRRETKVGCLSLKMGDFQPPAFFPLVRPVCKKEGWMGFRLFVLAVQRICILRFMRGRIGLSSV